MEQPVSESVQAREVVEPTEELCNFIAQAAHEVNRVWCEINNDRTKLHWSQSQGHLRVDTRAGVRCLLEKLNRGDLPEPTQQHLEWVEQRMEQSWSFGEVYDADMKIHPKLTPFEALPFVEQAKDSLFINTVINLYNAVQSVQRVNREAEQSDTVAPPQPDQPETQPSEETNV